MTKDICHNCQKNPAMHTTNGNRRLCCDCHMKEDGIPSDWHKRCMEIYYSNKRDE